MHPVSQPKSARIWLWRNRRTTNLLEEGLKGFHNLRYLGSFLFCRLRKRAISETVIPNWNKCNLLAVASSVAHRADLVENIKKLIKLLYNSKMKGRPNVKVFHLFQGCILRFPQLLIYSSITKACNLKTYFLRQIYLLWQFSSDSFNQVLLSAITRGQLCLCISSRVYGWSTGPDFKILETYPGTGLNMFVFNKKLYMQNISEKN